MDDDIDDLLNEVETKYCTSKKPSKSFDSSASASAGYGAGAVRNAPKKNTQIAKSSKKPSHPDAELNNMIDDIFDDPDEGNHMGQLEQKTRGASLSDSVGGGPSRSQGQSKCFPIFIGGCSCPLGLATGVNKRACDQLRCTDCDFKISTFDNYQWNSSTDYLFLRNNMPDFHRLKAKLVSKKGYRAYACQCKSTSCREMVDLSTLFDLKWVCGKH